MLDDSALKVSRPLFVTPCCGEKRCMNCVLSIIPLQRETIAAQMHCDFYFHSAAAADRSELALQPDVAGILRPAAIAIAGHESRRPAGIEPV